MSIVYKIRRADGLFSAGGSWPKFTKGGKIWKQKGHLTSHLNLMYDTYSGGTRDHYDDCEIVMYELIETPIGEMSIAGYRASIAQRREERESADQKRRDEWERQERQRQYEQLKKEFE